MLTKASLVEKLKARQNQEELTDQKFGGKLGISQQLWQMIRTGDRQIPSPVILKGIAKAYPELASDVLIFLGFDVEVSSLPDSILSKPYQTHQNGFLAYLPRWLRFLYFKLRFPRKVKAAQALKSKSKGKGNGGNKATNNPTL